MTVVRKVKSICLAFLYLLRWPEPIYPRVGCVFESRFSAAKKKMVELKENVVYFLAGIKTFEISAYV